MNKNGCLDIIVGGLSFLRVVENRVVEKGDLGGCLDNSISVFLLLCCRVNSRFKIQVLLILVVEVLIDSTPKKSSCIT